MFTEQFKLKALGLMAGASFLALASLPAQAGLLVDPTGGTPIFGQNVDDSQSTVNLGGNFNFYGSTINSITVSSNGYLTAGGDGSNRSDRGVGDLAAASGASVIAPLYDDLIHSLANSQTTSSSTVNYFAVTWLNLQGASAPIGTADQFSTFQAVLFLANTMIGSRDFLAGDIAFGYESLNHVISDPNSLGSTATVGVGKDTMNFTGLPGGGDGQITDLYGLPNPGFLLYRYDANSGNYIAYQVPEPGTLGLWVLGLAGLLESRRRLKANG